MYTFQMVEVKLGNSMLSRVVYLLGEDEIRQFQSEFRWCSVANHSWKAKTVKIYKDDLLQLRNNCVTKQDVLLNLWNYDTPSMFLLESHNFIYELLKEGK